VSREISFVEAARAGFSAPMFAVAERFTPPESHSQETSACLITLCLCGVRIVGRGDSRASINCDKAVLHRGARFVYDIAALWDVSIRW